MARKDSNNLFMNPVLWYVVSILVIFATFATIFFRRFTYDLEAPVENWVDTASYFNGILSPPLLAITSVLIFLTWLTTKKELKETKEQIQNQSIRETLIILLKDFRITLEHNGSLNELNLEACADRIIHQGFNPFEKENFNALFNFSLNEDPKVNKQFLLTGLKETMNKHTDTTVQSMITHYMQYGDNKDVGSRNFQEGLHYYLLICEYSLSLEGINNYIDTITTAITETLSIEMSETQFKLLSNIIICMLTIPVIGYLIFRLENKIKDIRKKINNKVDLERRINQLHVLNKVLEKTNNIPETYNRYKFLGKDL